MLDEHFSAVVLCLVFPSVLHHKCWILKTPCQVKISSTFKKRASRLLCSISFCSVLHAAVCQCELCEQFSVSVVWRVVLAVVAYGSEGIIKHAIFCVIFYKQLIVLNECVKSPALLKTQQGKLLYARLAHAQILCYCECICMCMYSCASVCW